VPLTVFPVLVCLGFNQLHVISELQLIRLIFFVKLHFILVAVDAIKLRYFKVMFVIFVLILRLSLLLRLMTLLRGALLHLASKLLRGRYGHHHQCLIILQCHYYQQVPSIWQKLVSKFRFIIVLVLTLDPLISLLDQLLSVQSLS